LDTGFSQLQSEPFRPMPLLRCLQTCTAAAALFALLGACGLAPPRSARVIVRPRPPRTEITIRSLTGVWDASVPTTEGGEPVTMSLAQTGDTLKGSLTIGGRTMRSDPARPANLDLNGAFALGFGQTHERVVVRGRPDATGRRISGRVSGLGPQPVSADFIRR
jgi:hypothetical protein